MSPCWTAIGGLYSLVDPGVVLPLPREAKHAADDAAVLRVPVGVADLLPLAAVLHLHVALRHGDALAVRRQDGPDPHVLHLDVEVLGEHHSHVTERTPTRTQPLTTPQHLIHTRSPSYTRPLSSGLAGFQVTSLLVRLKAPSSFLCLTYLPFLFISGFSLLVVCRVNVCSLPCFVPEKPS